MAEWSRWIAYHDGMKPYRTALLILTCFLVDESVSAKEIVLTPGLHQLRLGAVREWSDFPERAEGPGLSLRFQAQRNETEATLRLRQQDVKQTWKVLLNSQDLGRLQTDENDTILFIPIPPGGLVSGENRLTIEQVGKVVDDIRVGEITLDDRPLSRVLNEATVEVKVEDGEHKDRLLPCRITILNAQGALMTVGASSGGQLAVRPGVVYTGDGKARFGLPAGDYTLHAGRGFEYGIDTIRITVKAGDRIRKTLSIRREVPISGYVSCDTHVHTLTYSGHGDSTIDERVLTIAGEGITLPIATEHNRHNDYHAAAVRRNVRQYFTPVVGNEVTTSVGHFNIFPVKPEARIPDYKSKEWRTIFNEIDKTGAKVVILNHPRDLHSGYRPFGPEHHLALTGENLDGWELKANGMEVINSGAQQTDVMRPYHDWFGLLNRGIILTPVGASDSHDVSRFLVGQARTYIRCKNDKPGESDVSEAVANFLRGKVMVSLGLVAEITVNDRYGPGDLVPAKDEVKVAVRVLGPSWTTADKVELYANGLKIREAVIKEGKKAGVKWSGEWKLPRFKHDGHLVAIASGPAVTDLYWPIAKPYQPTSSVVARRVIGSTGAVWLDADGDGKRTCAIDYAQRMIKEAGSDWMKVMPALADYDEAVVMQAAGLLRAKGVSLLEPEVRAAARKAATHVGHGFQVYADSWRESQMARSRDKP
jgi:hypothetical protein